MTAPDHLRISGPEDILGFIPHSLGYWPENSLVAMTMEGKRLGATLRVDLPALGGGVVGGRSGGGGGNPAAPGRAGAGSRRRSSSGRSDALAGFARNVVSYLQADVAADGSLLAFFTDTDTNSDDGRPALAVLLKELELALEAAGMPVRDAWVIGAEFWRNAYCSDPDCCVPPGRPIEQITNSKLNAEMVFRGSSVGEAPGAQGTKPVPRPVDPAVRAAEFGWAAQFSSRRRDRAQFAQVLDVWTMVMQAAAQSPDLTPELTGYLRASLCIPSWRDAVLVMAAAGRPAAERGAEDFGMFDPQAGSATRPGTNSSPGPGPTPSPIPGPRPSDGQPAAGADAGSVPDAGPGADTLPGYGEVLLGLAPSVPDWALMVGLERVLQLLGSLGGGESTAAAMTARGWIEWCRGRGSYADALYRQALQDYPGYRLAELLAELGRRGTLCGWAARREAAWQKFAPDAA